MTVCLDTSAFLKLAVAEPASPAVHARLAASEAASSTPLRTESLRAARVHSREALARARQALETVTPTAVTEELCERAAELDPAIMRSLNTLHLAAALSLGPDLEAVVTVAARMAQARRLLDVAVLSPA